MIIYQLPNGKIVRLTLDEYLSLSEEDIIYLVSIDYGESAQNPWMGSSLGYNAKHLNFENYEESDPEMPDLSDFEDGMFEIPDDIDL